jgi:hypothetical protein
MYNKPITQRVAYARGKKASALKQTDLKQTEDTTVLKREIPVVTDKSTRQLPDTEETITTPGELTGSIAEPGGKQMPDDEWSDFCSKNPCNAACHKQFGNCPDKEETVTKKGGTEEVETPRYQYDMGDSMASYKQRKVYRGLKVGERQTKKALKAQLKAGAITKDEYKQGLADAATKRANAAKSFAETQAEAARQGQTFGKKGTTKIGTFDPNVRVSGKEGAVGRETTMADLGNAEEKLVNEKKRQDNLKAVETAKNQDAVNKRSSQDESGDNEDVKSPAGMKVGPIKMKSAFKMGGFGSKTYKK